MRFIYDGKLLNTLTIPFYAVGTPLEYSVRVTTEDGETLEKAYLCLLSRDFVGSVRGRIKGTSKFYKVGSIWDSEFFIGTVGNWSFVDLEIQINLPSTTESGPYRLPFVVLHGDREHGPNRNFCAEGGEDNYPLFGEDEYESPLWTGSQGGCPGYETGSSCGVPVYGHANPSESIPRYAVITTFLDVGIKKMRKATIDTFQHAAAVGMLIDDSIAMIQAVGTATAQSEDGRYLYEHGGQEVDSNGNLLDIWHNEIRVLDTWTGIWRNLGTCGEAKQRDHTLTLLNGVLYIMGGRFASYTPNGDELVTYYDSLYKFDLTTLVCTQLIDAPTARAGVTGIIQDAEIHYVGGWNTNGPISSVDWYDTVTGLWHTVLLPDELQPYAPTIYPYVGFPSAWSQLSPAPTGTAFQFSACLDGRLYTWMTGANVTRAQVYPNAQFGWDVKPLPVSWPAVFDLSFYLREIDAAGCGGKIYVGNPFYAPPEFGGYAEPKPLAVYDPINNSWTEITTSLPPALTIGGYYTMAGVEAIGAKLYFWGSDAWAQSSDLKQTVILVFDTVNNTWDQTVHKVGNERGTWKGAVVGNYLYQYEWWPGGQQKINLVNFTAEIITPPVDQDFGQTWAMSCEGKIYWMMWNRNPA